MSSSSEDGHAPIGLLSFRSAAPTDGIADYASLLQAALREAGASSVLALPSVPTRDRAAAAFAFREATEGTLRGAATLLLQYNPFTYGYVGYAPWLAPELRRWRRGSEGRRIVVTIHETYVRFLPPVWAPVALWQRWQLRQVARSADVLFGTTEAWRDQVHRWAGRSDLIHLPVASNLPDCGDQRAEARGRLKLAPDELVVASFSNGHPSHQAAVEATALAEIALSRPVLHLRLGARPAGAPLRNERIRVVAPGYQPAPDLASLIAAADLFLAPIEGGVSTRRTTVMAALQHGVPVLATRGHHTDRCLLESKSLRLVEHAAPEFAAAASQLANDEVARTRLGSAGRDLYRREFDWPVIARKLLKGLEY